MKANVLKLPFCSTFDKVNFAKSPKMFELKSLYINTSHTFGGSCVGKRIFNPVL